MDAWEKPGLTVEERARAVVGIDFGSNVAFVDALASALRAARRDALEEAAGYVARIADNARAPLVHRGDRGSPVYGYATQIADALDDAAATIRTLATSGEEGETK